MDNIIWFHDFLLYIITAITAFVLVLLVIVMVRFNARSQSDAVAHHPQHAARSGLDDRPDRHSAGDRGSLVQAAVLPAQSFRRPT